MCGWNMCWNGVVRGKALAAQMKVWLSPRKNGSQWRVFKSSPSFEKIQSSLEVQTHGQSNNETIINIKSESLIQSYIIKVSTRKDK